eukprot:COSAG01_NODE_24046_length_792_cov_1.691198_1_plen_174_part_00
MAPQLHPPLPSIGSDSYMPPQISNCRKLPRCFRANCRVGPPSRKTPLARSRSMCRVISSTTCVTNATGARVPDPRAPLSAALSLPTCPGVRPDQGQLPTGACPSTYLPWARGEWVSVLRLWLERLRHVHTRRGHRSLWRPSTFIGSDVASGTRVPETGIVRWPGRSLCGAAEA